MTKLSLISFIIVLLLGCEKSPEIKAVSLDKSTAINSQLLATETDVNNKKANIIPPQEPLPATAFMSAKWIDLMPKDDLDALLNPPEYLNDIVENSAEDQLQDSFQNVSGDSGEDRYQQALASTRVIAAINNVAIRMPAFIVPLEFDDERRVTQFFMVPYFGACIHLPPPPPNQTIFVNYPQGFTLDSLTEPYWISGILTTSLVENEMAVAAYTMEMHAFELYTDE
jgi:hypothetical protein